MSKFILLSEITSKIGSGATPHGGSGSYVEKGIAFIRSQNVQDMHFSTKGLVFLDDNQADKLKGVTVHQGDVLLNITGDSIARSCMVPDEILPARVNQHVAILRCKDRRDAEYISYYIQFLKSHLLQICKVGGTRNALTKDAISKLEINFPEDRHERAYVLQAINKKIALNNRINAELEAMAKALYDYWFVQFDFPDANGKPYKTSGGKMEYNATLKREIPAGWKIKKINEIALVKAGGDKPSNCVNFRSNEYSIPIFSNGISSEGLYGYTDIAVVNKPSITVSARGTIGYSVLRLKPFFPIIRLLVLTPYQDNALKFLEETIKRFSFENSGSVQQQLTVPQISEMSVLYPIEQLLNIYTKRIWPLIKKIELIKEQNSELQQLRDWLLPLLMNGQVTVK
ncbi:restriction endonuclease subunit S [Salmonella enterica subsp. enterica]|uniref:Restriction endonuclease subunit S n=1 Tax=Salmonella enterica subsp. enterica serovar Kenya TaxID=2564610 RepID=A0A5I0EYM0_SALET|nr:restriction endonuclease subunit S [Salmonella enterica subsp. enterica serovar Kenya]EAW1750117.1 restriction endonuclease subunit S [Salmonella enterica subsp. enterica]EBL8289300.1 restriction endonuclease subunit S [Salmonella enterica]EDE1994691.1 restriction endonuclease subunit S [Salmonella enterica subsp. enterica serovar Hissar]EDV0590147.1 restriction endonuclease subunit S [Salmonella enterica subsp. enterica serovar Gateshead]EDY0395831.1 restriction endonuclease subunit S [Sal